MLSRSCNACVRRRPLFWNPKESAIRQCQKPHTMSTCGTRVGTEGREAHTHTHLTQTLSHLPTLPPQNPFKNLFTQTKTGLITSTSGDHDHLFRFSIQLPLSVLASFLCFSTLCVLPQPTTEKVLFVHGLVFSNSVTILFRLPAFSFFAIFHNPLGSMKPPTQILPSACSTFSLCLFS